MDEEMGEVEFHPFNPEVVAKQKNRIEETKGSRDGKEVQEALDALKGAAQGDDNVMPHLLRAVKAYATLGEITRVFKDVFGEFKEPVGL
jgi:methylmalonyl-CoA mutase N-terminal domain/subunit